MTPPISIRGFVLMAWLSALVTVSQAAQVNWCITMPGSASGVAVDTNGNVFVTGKPVGRPFLMKLNPSGSQVWFTYFGSGSS